MEQEIKEPEQPIKKERPYYKPFVTGMIVGILIGIGTIALIVAYAIY